MIRHSRLGIVAVLLGAWLMLATGLPVAVVSRNTANVKDVNYPCMNCPCGCVSAAVCWDRCCCMSDVEKLSWAEKNGVTPPSFLIKRVAAQPAKPSKRACCCCSGKKDEIPPSPTASIRAIPRVESRVVVTVWATAKCRGIDLLWQTLTSGLTCLVLVTPIDSPLVDRWTPPLHGRPQTLSSVDPPVPLVGSQPASKRFVADI